MVLNRMVSLGMSESERMYKAGERARTAGCVCESCSNAA